MSESIIVYESLQSQKKYDKSFLWTPAYITTRGWWDASDLNNITDDGSGNVLQLDDLSGNNFHMVDGGSPSGQLKTGVHTLGALNTVSNTVSGTGQPFLAAAMTMPADHMFIAALNAYDGQFSQGHFSWNNSGNYWGYRMYRNTGNDIYSGGNGGTNLSLATTFPTVDNPLLFSGVFDGSGAGTKEIFFQGVSQGSNAYTNIDSNAAFRIGRNSDQSAKTYFGEGLFIPSDVSVSTRQRVEGYLAWKWGLAGFLPSNHPYKTFAPYR